MVPASEKASICTVGWAAHELGISTEYVRALLRQEKLEAVPCEGHLNIVSIASVAKLKKERAAKAKAK